MPRPGLRLGVVLIAVAVVVGMAVVVADMAARQLRQTASDGAMHNVEAIVRGYIDPRIGEDSLSLGSPVDEGISTELQRIIVSGNIRQINIWSRDGRIVYSTDDELRGIRQSLGDSVTQAFAGRSIAVFRPVAELLNPPAGAQPAQQYVEIYVPIRGTMDGNPLGVLSVLQDARPLNVVVEATRRDVFMAALAAATVLLLVIAAAFAGASRRLAHQNRTLRERGAREKLLTTDLRRNEERFRSLVRNSTDVILICDSKGTILFETAAVARVLGYTVDQRVGTNGFESIHPLDRGWATNMLAELIDTPDAEATAEYRCQHADGSWRWLEATARNLLHDPAVAGIVVNYRDVTERRSLEEQLRYAAFHDSLTGLPNRALFLDRLGHALVRARRDIPGLAVLFIDLDDFKNVNDSIGHGAGDELLVAVAQRITATLREVDTAARMGGDEFAVLLEAVGIGDGPLGVSERLLAALRQPFTVHGHEVRVSASIGVASSEGPDQGAEELLRHADVAMYASKNQGKDRVTLFQPEVHRATIDRHQLRADLAVALERGQLSLAYQPLARLPDSEFTGCEALLRWKHPIRGSVPPAEFVPLAEENGVIVVLGRWVLQQACREAVRLAMKVGRPLQMSVNLSGRQIEDERLVADVQAALVASGLDPGLLTLEITESVLLDDIETVVGRLNALKQLGVRLAIDDFGTGYSSLSYLRRLPVDILKIDQSFIAGVESGAAEAALVRSIVSLAQILELRTVAEGIEEPGQLETLLEMGVDSGQGFLLATPMASGDALVALLRRDIANGIRKGRTRTTVSRRPARKSPVRHPDARR